MSLVNRRFDGGELINRGIVDGDVQVPVNVVNAKYPELEELPLINGHTLLGDMSSADDLEIEVLKDELSVSRTVGGCSSGTSYAQGTTLEKILRDMLNPTDYPSLTNPSVSLLYSGTKLLESGSSIQATLNASFNRGSINPAYGTSGYRSGPATGYSLNGGVQQSQTSWSVTVDSSNKQFTATAYYSEGEQPKDSVGNDYDSPLPAGSVNSSQLTFEFVDAIWASIPSISTVSKQTLISKSTRTKTFVFPAQTVQNPETFDIPASWTVNTIEVLNELSGKYEDCSSEFRVSTTTHPDAAGNEVSYKRYTDNRGYASDTRTIKITWS